ISSMRMSRRRRLETLSTSASLMDELPQLIESTCIRTPRKWSASRSKLVNALAQGLQRRIEGLDELLQAVFLELGSNLVHVDAEPAETCQDLARAFWLVMDAFCRVAMILIRGKRLEGQRRHGVAPDQRFDVLDIRVLGILRARARPEQPLTAGALALERSPALAVDDGLIAPIGQTCRGDGSFAFQRSCRLLAARIQPPIYQGIDTAQEEARNRCDVVDGLLCGETLFEAAHVRVGDRHISFHAEEQRDIDVHSFCRQAADRRQ